MGLSMAIWGAARLGAWMGRPLDLLFVPKFSNMTTRGQMGGFLSCSYRKLGVCVVCAYNFWLFGFFAHTIAHLIAYLGNFVILSYL